MEPAESYLRQLWGPMVRLVFNLPLEYYIPLTELVDNIWFLESEDTPGVAKALHCQTVIECECYHCAMEPEEDWYSGYHSC